MCGRRSRPHTPPPPGLLRCYFTISLEQNLQMRNMDTIFIKNLHLQGIIGVNEQERVTPQDILVNVAAFTDTRRAAQSDDIRECVDYSLLAKEIRLLVEARRRFTVEALAEDIADLCLRRPGVQRVTVRVEKLGAVTGAESVGVEIERP